MRPSIPHGALPYSVNGNKTVQDKTKHVRQNFEQVDEQKQSKQLKNCKLMAKIFIK